MLSGLVIKSPEFLQASVFETNFTDKINPHKFITTVYSWVSHRVELGVGEDCVVNPNT